MALDVKKNYDLLFLIPDGLWRVTPTGEVISNVSAPDGCPDFHHEMYVENENTAWTMNIEILNEGYPTIPADIGDTIVQWKLNNDQVSTVAKTSEFISRDDRFPPESNLIAFTYVACKNLSITKPNTEDWTHGNSLKVSEDGDFLVFSSRSLSTVYLLDRDTYQLSYKIGGSESDFTFGTGANFSVQHSVFMLSHDRLLLFDNGMYNELNPRISRGLLLKINFDTMEVTKIWDYFVSVNTTCFAQFMGSSVKHEDDDGNESFLINFSTCNWVNGASSDISYIAELDSNGNEKGLYVYNVVDSWFNYRARPYDSILGEFYPY